MRRPVVRHRHGPSGTMAMRKDRAPGRGGPASQQRKRQGKPETGTGRVDDRRRRCLKIGNDGAAAPFLQLALPSFRRSLALGNVAKGRSTEQVGLLPDALHRGNVARFADAMAGHARSPQKAKAVWPLASVKLALSPAA